MIDHVIIGASLSEPHIDGECVPRARKLCMYVSIYLSRGAFVAFQCSRGLEHAYYVVYVRACGPCHNHAATPIAADTWRSSISAMIR